MVLLPYLLALLLVSFVSGAPRAATRQLSTIETEPFVMEMLARVKAEDVALGDYVNVSLRRQAAGLTICATYRGKDKAERRGCIRRH